VRIGRASFPGGKSIEKRPSLSFTKELLTGAQPAAMGVPSSKTRGAAGCFNSTGDGHNSFYSCHGRTKAHS
jgi:hypothetical protein